MLRIISLGFVLVMLSLVSACSTNKATGRDTFTAFMSPDEAIEIGAQQHPLILKQYGGPYRNVALQAYVNDVGQRLVKVSELPNLNFTFTVLDDDIVNAFALPGGYVYISRGLLSIAQSEAEMAGVLAHEIGHVTADHTAERYSQQVAANIGAAILGAIGSLGGVSGVDQVARAGNDLWLKSYSRDQELEADMLGVRYLSRAGYDTRAVASLFQSMQAADELESRLRGQESAAERYSLLSTHPRTADRIDQAFQLAAVQQSPQKREGREDFLSNIDGMTWGTRRSDGVIKGNKLLNPVLRFSFQVPPGYNLFHSPNKVLATGPDDAIVAFDFESAEVARNASSDIAEYMQNDWVKALNLQKIVRLNVNGMDGATATTRIRQQNGDYRHARLVAIRDNAFKIYRFMFLSPMDKTQKLDNDFRDITFSLRRLSKAEASRIRPKRVKVFTAVSGDTQQSLARRMAVATAPLESFQVLNALSPREPIVVGRQYKMIVD